MTRLVLDLGNTRDKVAVFEGRELRALETVEDLQWSHLGKILDSWHPALALVSGTGDPRPELSEALAARLSTLLMGPAIRLPFENCYQSPETLGNDRLAGLAGAMLHAPGKALLVIDAGTCVTVDSLDAEGRYFGGSIAPGWRMRLEAMHTLTARLPLIEIDMPMPAPLVGTDTRSSMISGALNGARLELAAMVVEYRERIPDLQVFLTGGDAGFFVRLLKSRIFAIPNLVLEGLNHILEHHVEHPN